MYAQKKNGVWKELYIGEMIEYLIDNQVYKTSYDSMARWSEEERQSVGIFVIQDGEPTPQGKYLSSRKVVERDLRPIWSNSFENIVSNETPSEVTMRQAKIVLSRAGRLAQANAAIEAMQGQQGEEARIEWQYATVLRRDHPLVLGIGQALGMDEITIDTLFKEAAKV